MHKRRSRGIGLIVLLVILLGVAAALWQWQAIFDWARLRNYKPSEAIAQLASTTTMTPKAEHLFYVFHPALEDKSVFNNNCPNQEQTIVLGCYVTNQGIYLYDVQDARLQGVKQVTAAHEMLHVAYQRLSSSEKQKVDAMLQDAYSQVTDARIRANIDSYKTAGADINNELHSILGTEVANLPPALEEYYKQYFTDRGQIVAFAAAYAQEFDSRKQQVAQYDAQLAGLKLQIQANEEALSQQQSALEAQQKTLDSQLARKDYASYNAGVPGYNAAVQQYNKLAQTTREQITTYNNIVNERNKIAIEEQNLSQALDSRLQTQTTR